MARTRFVSNDAGFTIIEVIVAIAIFSIGLMAMGALQTTRHDGDRRCDQKNRSLDSACGAGRTAQAVAVLRGFSTPKLFGRPDKRPSCAATLRMDAIRSNGWWWTTSPSRLRTRPRCLVSACRPAFTRFPNRLPWSAFRTGANPLAPPWHRWNFSRWYGGARLFLKPDAGEQNYPF